MYSCDLMMSCLCSPGGDDRGDLTQFKEGMAKVGSKVTKMELVTSVWFESITVYSVYSCGCNVHGIGGLLEVQAFKPTHGLGGVLEVQGFKPTHG